MTKTLTKQWREGKLPAGLYYIEGKGNHDIALIRNRYCPVLTSPYSEDGVFEPEFVPVVPVPSYEEWKELKEQRDWYETRTYERAALINELRKQLKEANEIISIYRCYDDTEVGKATEYCKKWGVK